MNKKVLCIDLDSVLIANKAIEIAASELGLKHDETTSSDWHYMAYPEDLRTLIFKLFHDPNTMCKNVRVLPGVIETLTRWKAEGHILYVITARVAEIREATVQMVKETFPMIDQLYFVGFNESKVDTLKFLLSDLFIDDSHFNVEDALKNNINTIMISNKYTKYNHHLRLREDVRWVKAIKDIQL